MGDSERRDPSELIAGEERALAGEGYRLVNPTVHEGLNGSVLVTGLQIEWIRVDLSSLRRTRYAFVGAKWPSQERRETVFSPDSTKIMSQAFKEGRIVPTLYGHGILDSADFRSLDELCSYSPGLVDPVATFLGGREIVFLSVQTVYSKDDGLHMEMAAAAVPVCTDDALPGTFADFPAYKLGTVPIIDGLPYTHIGTR